jgi:hypothetical protein
MLDVISRLFLPFRSQTCNGARLTWAAKLNAILTSFLVPTAVPVTLMFFPICTYVRTCTGITWKASDDEGRYENNELKWRAIVRVDPVQVWKGSTCTGNGIDYQWQILGRR